MSALEIFILIITIIIPIFTIFISIMAKYNQLVSLKHKIKESYSSVDICLKMRFDLIPNLVQIVKGYAKHEQETFEQIAKLRTQVSETTNKKEKVEIANKTIPLFNRILLVAENYPKLKSDEMFKRLFDELVEIEDRISAARRFYNANINDYNTEREVFPSNIVAKMFKFNKYELYQIQVNETITPII